MPNMVAASRAQLEPCSCSSVLRTCTHLEVSGQETSTHIESVEGIAPEDQVVLLGGTPLEDGSLIGQCGISKFTILEVAAHMLGGKVHGSLTRAGKVRGQAPEVAKQARSCRRLAVPRDACNTTGALSISCQALARRKGPNANS
ncbi:unnamed protein product [Caretta caretta]